MLPTDSSTNILCISPNFPPAANSEAFVTGKMMDSLLDCGVNFVAICRGELDPEGTDPASLWTKCVERSIRLKMAEIQTLSVPQRAHAMYLSARFRCAGSRRFVRDAVKTAISLSSENIFNYIYSRSGPMTAHIAGYWCSKALNIPWVANINDPWAIALNPHVKHVQPSLFESFALRHWLKTTIRRADLITYPSKQLHDFHQGLSGLKHQAKVIPHIGVRSPVEVQSASGLTLVHAGHLGASEIIGGRSTVALLQAMARLCESYPGARDILKLRLVGPIDPSTAEMAERFRISALVEQTGRVSYERSLEHIASAQVCVLVEHAMEEGIYFPSKLADYIAARKPILAISPAIGVVADLAHHGGIMHADPRSEQQLYHCLDVLFHKYKAARLSELSPSSNLLNIVDPEYVSRKFIDATNQILNDKYHVRL